ncbi:MAG: ThiF family adenylyltransferase, partial [Bacteroidia bacterium]|nr:ThiF family adenylyltransferase [Bacteroidia bacterium]
TIFSDYDIVVDGCDNFATRYIVNDVCVKQKKTLISGSILGYEGQLAVFNFRGSRNLRDIFPEPPASDDVPNCSENGVLGTLPAILGSMMAHETLQVILERSALANTFLIYHSLNLSFTKLRY